MVARRNFSKMFFVEQAAGQNGGGTPPSPPQPAQPFATDKGPRRISEDDFNSLPPSVQDEVQEMHPDILITPGDAANGKLPPEYARLFQTKDRSGTTLMAVDTYAGPFKTDPQDDAIRATRENRMVQWDRMGDGSVRIETTQGDTRTVEQIFRNADGSTTVITDQTQRDNAVNHANSDTARARAEGTPDAMMTVHVVKQYDADGKLTERTIDRTMDGGPEQMNATAKVTERYEHGRLAGSDYYSSTRTLDASGAATTITVDKHAGLDERGVTGMHREYTSIKTDNGNETVERTIQDSSRDTQPGADGKTTYTMQSGSYRQVNGKVTATDNSTLVAADSEGKQGISGNRVVTSNGTQTMFKADPDRNGWVVDADAGQGQVPNPNQGMNAQKKKAEMARVRQSSPGFPSA